MGGWVLTFFFFFPGQVCRQCRQMRKAFVLERLPNEIDQLVINCAAHEVQTSRALRFPLV